jgi:hypothetical protein
MVAGEEASRYGDATHKKQKMQHVRFSIASTRGTKQSPEKYIHSFE